MYNVEEVRCTMWSRKSILVSDFIVSSCVEPEKLSITENTEQNGPGNQNENLTNAAHAG